MLSVHHGGGDVRVGKREDCSNSIRKHLHVSSEPDTKPKDGGRPDPAIGRHGTVMHTSVSGMRLQGREQPGLIRLGIRHLSRVWTISECDIRHTHGKVSGASPMPSTSTPAILPWCFTSPLVDARRECVRTRDSHEHEIPKGFTKAKTKNLLQRFYGEELTDAVLNLNAEVEQLQSPTDAFGALPSDASKGLLQPNGLASLNNPATLVKVVEHASGRYVSSEQKGRAVIASVGASVEASSIARAASAQWSAHDLRMAQPAEVSATRSNRLRRLMGLEEVPVSTTMVARPEQAPRLREPKMATDPVPATESVDLMEPEKAEVAVTPSSSPSPLQVYERVLFKEQDARVGACFEACRQITANTDNTANILLKMKSAQVSILQHSRTEAALPAADVQMKLTVYVTAVEGGFEARARPNDPYKKGLRRHRHMGRRRCTRHLRRDDATRRERGLVEDVGGALFSRQTCANVFEGVPVPVDKGTAFRMVMSELSDGGGDGINLEDESFRVSRHRPRPNRSRRSLACSGWKVLASLLSKTTLTPWRSMFPMD